MQIVFFDNVDMKRLGAMLYALPVVVGGWLVPVALDAGVWVVTLPGRGCFTVVLGLDVTVLRLGDFDAVTKQCALANPGS